MHNDMQRAVERLDLAFLVDGQHHGVAGWISPVRTASLLRDSRDEEGRRRGGKIAQQKWRR